MKIVHLADTHLGYMGTGVQQHVEDPYRPGIFIKQQEVDIMNGFRNAIDCIVEKVRPDVVIHSGDLFDHAHPTPYAIDFAMQQIRRLGDAQIPLVIVEGDHSSPRIAGQGQVLRLLMHLPRVHVVCGDRAEIVFDGMLIHAVPYRAVVDGYRLDQSSCAAGRIDVLVTHAVADGLPFYDTSRRAFPLPIRAAAHKFDYIALGHSHRFSQVRGTECAFYAGATAMVARSDFRPGYNFGFNVVEFDGGPPVVKRQELPTIAMHAYGLHDARGLSRQDVMNFLERQVSAVPPVAAYCQVEILGLDPLTKRSLSLVELTKLFEGYAGLELQLRARELTQEEVALHQQETSPVARFQRLAEAQEGDTDFKTAVQFLQTFHHPSVAVCPAEIEELFLRDVAGDRDGPSSIPPSRRRKPLSEVISLSLRRSL